MIDFAKSLPVNYKVKVEDGQKYGKWILRKLFENKIPKSVVWRKKAAMQDGAGTSGLISMFNDTISDEFFKEETKKIAAADKVLIKSKESLLSVNFNSPRERMPSNVSRSFLLFVKNAVENGLDNIWT